MNDAKPRDEIWTLIALLGHEKHRDDRDSCFDQIRTLLESGADPDGAGEPPLALAARTKRVAVAELLLDHGADVDGGCTYRTPLVLAARHRGLRELLLEYGARESIFSAVAWGEAEKVAAALEEDPELVHFEDEHGATLLFVAADACDLPMMQRLLEAGADPNVAARGSGGVSPIHGVSCGRRSDAPAAIELLAAHGADLDARNVRGVTALHMAVRDRNVPAVRALLAHGASPDLEDRGRRSTPLRRAVANTGRGGTGGRNDDALEITRLLLEAGADPEHVNASGKRVIDSTRNSAIRALLLEASPSERNDS